MAKRTGVPSRWVVVGLLAVGNAACSAGEQPRVRAVVRDSAGITIVENSVPLWRDEEEWRLTAEPVVQIGVVIGADRKSTRLNSSHVRISYAVFCLKKKKKKNTRHT